MALEEGATVDEVIEGEDTAGTTDETIEGGEGEDTVNGGSGDTIVVSIGDEAPKVDEEEEKIKKVPAFVQLRDAHKSVKDENKELRRQIDAINGAKVAEELGEKPTHASCGYDDEKFETELLAWNGRKQKIEDAKRVQQEAQDKADADWAKKVEGYGKAKIDFAARAPDYADAEAAIDESFTKVQRGIILKVSKDAPLFYYALFKNPAKLKELAAITDPVEFTWTSAQLEPQLKVTSRSPEFKPETPVKGVRVVGSGADATLERLRNKAAQTNDYTEVNAYKAQVKARQQKSA